MSKSQVLSLRPDVKLVEQPNGQVALQGQQINFVFNALPAGVLDVLKKLLTEGGTEQELAHLASEQGGLAVIPHVYLCLHQLDGLKVICRTIRQGASPLATLIPISAYHHYCAREIAPETLYVLSRFAYCRQENDRIVLESPLAYERIILHNWQASALWAELKVPLNSDELSRAIPGMAIEVVQEYLALLLNAQVLQEATQDSEADTHHPDLRQWEFHDLLFHARSRLGRHTNPYGGTYRFFGKIDSLPVVKPESSSETIPLFPPDRASLPPNDISFLEVLENRKSLRQQGDVPLTQEQLGEFLFHTARLKSVFLTQYGELSSRPYPSGGASYELELYPVIDRCTGIPAGLYHYCPQKHALAKLSDRDRYVQTLLEMAWHTVEKNCQPQVLLVITARYSRVSWKYQSMAYALILKHVGVLYQTMYLVATAMGLAPCALGGGDSDLFALAAELDYYSETSVGEFILGSQA